MLLRSSMGCSVWLSSAAFHGGDVVHSLEELCLYDTDEHYLTITIYSTDHLAHDSGRLLTHNYYLCSFIPRQGNDTQYYNITSGGQSTYT